MATVTLDRLWLVNVATAETISSLTDTGRDQVWLVSGAVRTYAGGRQRAISTAGMAGTWTITLVEVPLTTVALLKTWLENGVTVLVRDHRAQSMYGTFFQVDIGEKFGKGPLAVYTVKVAFLFVDVAEGV